ncbi:hypothetical protein VKT23_002730 [Stygiomarasmius scandens]|uniref:Uncharacterized protein n=1 Tax=Marasmiellus scandens TaxID=2682957 RepID=A0ABR1K4R3_9AGAR
MRFLGQLEHGIYDDEFIDVDPEILEQYFGADKSDSDSDNSDNSDSSEDMESLQDNEEEMQDLSDNSSSQSMSSDKDDTEWSALEDQVAEDIESQFYHAPVAIPKHSEPFSTTQHRQNFQKVFENIVDDDFLPAGFGILEDEWENEEYPSSEILKSGRRGGKEIHIPLPVEEWLPLARLWVQALVAMNECI